MSKLLQKINNRLYDYKFMPYESVLFKMGKKYFVWNSTYFSSPEFGAGFMCFSADLEQKHVVWT
jgi:hypothetical protein